MQGFFFAWFSTCKDQNFEGNLEPEKTEKKGNKTSVRNKILIMSVSKCLFISQH